eukprot:COSAG02_NODE_4405_length_5400_cov_103.134752_5_plen_306_part_00
MPKRSKSKKQQPVIIPVDSEDKQGLDPLPPQDHPASCCRAQRTLFCAPPHTGGTSTIKNCLVRSAPWAAVVIISGVGEHTAEWDKVVHTKTTFEEADADWWSALSKKHGGEPIACVVDDMDYSGLGVLAKKARLPADAIRVHSYECYSLLAHALVDAVRASHPPCMQLYRDVEADNRWSRRARLHCEELGVPQGAHTRCICTVPRQVRSDCAVHQPSTWAHRNHDWFRPTVLQCDRRRVTGRQILNGYIQDKPVAHLPCRIHSCQPRQEHLFPRTRSQDTINDSKFAVACPSAKASGLRENRLPG